MRSVDTVPLRFVYPRSTSGGNQYPITPFTLALIPPYSNDKYTRRHLARLWFPSNISTCGSVLYGGLHICLLSVGWFFLSKISFPFFPINEPYTLCFVA